MCVGTYAPEGNVHDNAQINVDKDDPNKGMTALSRTMHPYAVEKQDGKWMRSGSIEAEVWRDDKTIDRGTPSPPDMVNERPINQYTYPKQESELPYKPYQDPAYLKAKFFQGGKQAQQVKSQALERRKKANLEIQRQPRGKSTQSDMGGNITTDKQLRKGGINL